MSMSSENVHMSLLPRSLAAVGVILLCFGKRVG